MGNSKEYNRNYYLEHLGKTRKENPKSLKKSKEYHKRWRKSYYKNNKDKILLQQKIGYNKIATFKSLSRVSWCEDIREVNIHEEETVGQVRCTNSDCGEWFYPSRGQVNQRVSALKNKTAWESRFYCSDKCANSCVLYRQVKYYKDKKPNMGREVQPELRDMVLERDNYECQRCGNKESLECHHIEGIEQNPIESADMDICIIFCSKCHKLAHAEKGCRYVDLWKKC